MKSAPFSVLLVAFLLSINGCGSDSQPPSSDQGDGKAALQAKPAPVLKVTPRNSPYNPANDNVIRDESRLNVGAKKTFHYTATEDGSLSLMLSGFSNGSFSPSGDNCKGDDIKLSLVWTEIGESPINVGETRYGLPRKSVALPVRASKEYALETTVTGDSGCWLLEVDFSVEH